MVFLTVLGFGAQLVMVGDGPREPLTKATDSKCSKEAIFDDYNDNP